MECLKCRHDETEHRNDVIHVTKNGKGRSYNRMCEHRNCKCRGLLLRDVVE